MGGTWRYYGSSPQGLPPVAGCFRIEDPNGTQKKIGRELVRRPKKWWNQEDW